MTYRIGIWRFCAWFIGLSIGLPLLFEALRSFAGLDLASSGASILPMMIASMQEGSAFARTERRRPGNAEAWRFAVSLTALGAGLTVVTATASVLLVPSAMALAAGMSVGAVAMIAGVVIVLYLGLARIFFGLGARSRMKVIEQDPADGER
ncbi:MAG: ABZJ_00895 family protein [Rhodobacteraceae bacterium]|nr:ABZJ_00895 family protein [Paracoccaceae bacterium]